jgi:chorismate mutase
VGLITGLITLPLAPVRATTWLAERLLEQAEAEYYSEERIRELLAEVHDARAAGELDPAEAARIEDELLERLLAARELGY